MSGDVSIQELQTIATGGYVPPKLTYSSYPASSPYPQYWYIATPPTVCSGDVHVFPCPHCNQCKCGAATVKRAKKG